MPADLLRLCLALPALRDRGLLAFAAVFVRFLSDAAGEDLFAARRLEGFAAGTVLAASCSLAVTLPGKAERFSVNSCVTRLIVPTA